MAKPITEVVKIGRRGGLLRSQRVRAAFALNEGDELGLSIDEDQLGLRRQARRFVAYLDSLTTKS